MIHNTWYLMWAQAAITVLLSTSANVPNVFLILGMVQTTKRYYL